MHKKIIILLLVLTALFLSFQNDLVLSGNNLNSTNLITEMQKPTYPKYAVANRKEGKVSLIVIVKPTGEVDNILFEKYTGTNEIDQMAYKTIENKWHFSGYEDQYAYKVDFSFHITSDEVPEVSCEVQGPEKPDKLIRNLDFIQMVSVASLELVESELKKGVDINDRDESDRTPLMYAAAFNDDPEVIRILAESNARVNARDKDGLSPLIIAVSNENTGAVEVLLELGANVNAIDGLLEYSSLIWAIEKENIEIIEMLLEAGADVNARYGVLGYSSLIRALQKENPDIVRILLQAGADPDLIYDDLFNRTPLMYFAQESEDPETAKEIVNLFIDYGVDGSITCIDGKTAFDYAEENENLKNTEAYWRLNDIQY